MTRSLTTVVLLPLLLTACATTRPAPPSDATCDALRPALPTWSRQDTERSRAEAARFLAVWEAVCDDD